MWKIVKALLLAGVGAFMGYAVGNVEGNFLSLTASLLIFIPIPVGTLFFIDRGWSFGSPLNILFAFPGIFSMIFALLAFGIRVIVTIGIGYFALGFYLVTGIMEIVDGARHQTIPNN